tara:strand:+ start:611 stop:802 length:192 start_codon:yes stop_codon:yes gene_type:complete
MPYIRIFLQKNQALQPFYNEVWPFLKNIKIILATFTIVSQFFLSVRPTHTGQVVLEGIRARSV